MPTDAGLEALRERVESAINKEGHTCECGQAAVTWDDLDSVGSAIMEAIAKHNRPLIEAAARIAQFGVLAEAIAGDEHPFKDGDVLLAIMGSGASDALRWEDMRKLIEALR